MAAWEWPSSLRSIITVISFLGLPFGFHQSVSDGFSRIVALLSCKVKFSGFGSRQRCWHSRSGCCAGEQRLPRNPKCHPCFEARSPEPVTALLLLVGPGGHLHKTQGEGSGSHTDSGSTFSAPLRADA